MTIVLKGEPVADSIKSKLLSEIRQYKRQGVEPKIGILRVGEDKGDLAYEQQLLADCSDIGMKSRVVAMADNVLQKDFMAALDGMNDDFNVHGILVLRPLPKHLDSAAVGRKIDPVKDIDCMSPVNIGKIFTGENDGIAPCTPEAIMEILNHYKCNLRGKHAVIVNRSPVLGKLLAVMMLEKDATVTVCHSKTNNLAKFTKEADIVITGVGRPRFFDHGYFSDRTFIIDAGINFEKGKLFGDVDYKDVYGHVSAITPVPGGVGPVTSMVLQRHVLDGISLSLKERK